MLSSQVKQDIPSDYLIHSTMLIDINGRKPDLIGTKCISHYRHLNFKPLCKPWTGLQPTIICCEVYIMYLKCCLTAIKCNPSPSEPTVSDTIAV